MLLMTPRRFSIPPPLSPIPSLRARVIRVDDALGGPAGGGHLALGDRGVAAFEVVVVPALVDLQADRIVRVVGLGACGRHRRNRCDGQDRKAWKPHRKSPL